MSLAFGLAVASATCAAAYVEKSPLSEIHSLNAMGSVNAPAFMHISIDIGKTSSRPGAVRIGQAASSLYTNIYTCEYATNTCENKQSAWGGVPGAALQCPYVHASLHTTWETSSRPGAGCLGPIISLCMCIHTYKMEAISQHGGWAA